jgi:hypothetical protein
MSKVILGGPLPDPYESARKAAYEKVAKDPEKYCVVDDMETGFPQVMTIEQRDEIAASWEACKPKGDFELKGPIVFFGTGGSNFGTDFKDLYLGE